VECAYLAERMPLDGRMVLTKLKEAAGKMHQACVPIHESSRSHPSRRQKTFFAKLATTSFGFVRTIRPSGGTDPAREPVAP